METINKRIFRLLGSKHGILRELSSFIGISDTTVNAWKSRGSGIDAEYIPAIAEFLGVSETYLLTGKEEQNKNDFFSQDEIALIMAYRELPLSTKEFVFNSVTAQPIQSKVQEAREKAEVYKNKYKQALSAHKELAE